MKLELSFDLVNFADYSAFMSDQFTITHRAASNDFHCATNLFNFTLRYDATLFTALRAMTSKAYVRYTDDSSVVQFYGYFMPSTSYGYDGVLEVQTCNIEAQDFTELLRVPVGAAEDDDVAWQNYAVLDPTSPSTSIVHVLFTKIGLSTALIASGVSIPTTVGAFASSSYEDEALGMLDTLLYEYGYVCNWNREGKFEPIQWIIPSGTAFDYTFTGSNIALTLDETVNPTEFEGNQVIWYGLQTASGTRLYTEDLPWEDDGDFEGYAVLNGFNYPPEASVIDDTTGDYQKVYQEYNDTGVRYKTAGKYVEEEYFMDFALSKADFSEILITSNHVVSDSYTAGLTRDVEEFFNKRARIRYRNTSGSTKLLYYMHIDADIVYKRSQRKTKIQTISGSNKLNTYESRFIFDETTADTLCAAQTQAMLTGNRIYKFQSEENVEEGSYVRILPGNGVDANGIVIEKAYDGYTQMYSYEVAGFTATYRAPTGREVTTAQMPPSDTIVQSYSVASDAESKAISASGVASSALSLATTVSGVAYAATKTWFQAAAPTISSRPNAINGDRWLDSDDSNKVYEAISGNWALQSYTIPLDPAAYWSADETPDIPDYAAGIYYLQDAWATTDSWSVNQCTIVATSGVLRVTSTVTSEFRISRAISTTAKTVRFRIKNHTGTRTDYSIRYTIGTEQTTEFTISVADWTVVDCYLATAGTATSISIRCDQTGGSIGDGFDLDWFYIGTAQYTTPLIDNSGNGRHATIYGATPVEGISGKALYLDGTNDYVESVATYTMPAIFSFSAWLLNPQTSNIQIILNYGAPGTSGWYEIRRLNSGDFLSVAASNGTSNISVNLTGFFTGYSASFIHVYVSVVWATGVLTVYRNGELVTSGTLNSVVKPDGKKLSIGKRTADASYWYTGYIDEPMIFSRALSAAEVLGLYNAKALPSKYSLAKYMADNDYPPKYLGATTTAPTGTPHKNDWYIKTAATYGIYVFDGYAWAKSAAPTTAQISAAWPDICDAINDGLGAASDYCGTGINFIDVLGANTAFINKLFAQFIKIQTGGSIRGGDRYDQNGTVVDGTVPGFFISASGSCRVAGLEFEGSQGGGVQWGMPTIIGSGLVISGMTSMKLSHLTGNLAAVIDRGNDHLGTYQWNGSTITQSGTIFELSTLSSGSYTFVDANNLCTLNTTDIYITYNETYIGPSYRGTLMRWNGSTWAAISTTGGPVNAGYGISTAALNSTTMVACINAADNHYDLSTYSLSGTTFSKIGNTLHITDNTGGNIFALNSTDIVAVGSYLTTYRWNGTDWSKVGSSLLLPNSSTGAPLNATDVVILSSAGATFSMYRWNGSVWTAMSIAGAVDIDTGASGVFTACAMNGSDVLCGSSKQNALYVYRFGFALSSPWRYPFTS